MNGGYISYIRQLIIMLTFYYYMKSGSNGQIEKA